ncbi:MAG: hypothetical protein GY829_00015, partial [Gammaproteobacteria bacterium]|nr:hypothetical protein [Gammaproteobacteria bacterium]
MKNNKSMLLALTGMGMMLGLASCSGGGDGLDEPLAAQTQSVPVRMAATYSLSPTTDIPVPNDLLFGDSDLTLNFQPDDPDNFADPKVAMGALDGWSSISPLSISFHSNDSDLAIDPDTVVGGSTVHVYKVIVLREEALSGTGIILPTGPVTSVERELTANLEYVVLASSSTSIAILPTVPFEQQESYMVVVTNGLLDSDGLPVLNDSQYAIAKSRDAIDPDSSVGALEPVRQLVNAMEDAAAAEGVPHANIILSYQFTVQSMGTVLSSAKTLYIDGPLAAGATPFTSFSNLNVDTTDITGQGAADLYKGMIAIPYMLGVPSPANEEAPLNTFWIAAPELPTGTNGAMEPNPYQLALGDNLTYANSYPKVNTVELAPLLVSMPKVANCPKPAAGYKVAIFQHGITGNRTNALGIVDALAASCTAVVSMDQPIHGISEDNDLHLLVQQLSGGAIGLFEGYTEGGLRERTFGIDFMNNTTGELGIPDGTPDPSGGWTINLSNLLVSRDNVRQAIFDLLLLEKAIASMDIDGDGDADFDSTNISFVG